MFITADQLLCHLIGDYILQSHWMATEKIKQSFACFMHVCMYTLPFCFLDSSSVYALIFILISHFLIDRFRLAKYVCFLKNNICPNIPLVWKDHNGTGYNNNDPAWLTVWLLIITDNIMHIICNGIALKFL